MTIHIVEDDPGVSDSLTLVLEQMGHEAQAHPDAESFFEHDPPGAQDTLIVDLGLPGISGVQVIRWVQRLACPPRVIAISGQSRTMIDRQIGDLVIPKVLRKPLSQEALLEVL